LSELREKALWIKRRYA
jgi:hypothetical protein